MASNELENAPIRNVERLKASILQGLDSTSVTVVMTLASVYALFGDDLRLAVLSKDVDDAFAAISTTVFAMFIVEVVLQIFARPGYLPLPDWRVSNCTSRRFHRFFSIGSFYFWLDAIATVSLVFEIPYIVPPESANTIIVGDGAAARAGRASRAAARAARVLRAVRIARLVRVIRIYRYFTVLLASLRSEEGCIRSPPPGIAGPCRALGCEWGSAITLSAAAKATGRRWRCRCLGRLCCVLPEEPQAAVHARKGVHFSVSVDRGIGNSDSDGDGGGGNLDSDSDDPFETLRRRAARGPSGKSGSDLRRGDDLDGDEEGGGEGGDMEAAARMLRQRRGGGQAKASADNNNISRVGAQLSDLTTRRVIVGVLLMMIVVPLLTVTELDAAPEFGTSLVHTFSLKAGLLGSAALASQAALAVVEMQQQVQSPLLRLRVNGSDVVNNADAFDALRLVEMSVVKVRADAGFSVSLLGTGQVASLAPGQSFDTEAWFDTEEASRQSAAFSLGLTLLVLLVLALGAYSFNRDLQRLVLTPLEQVVALVRQVSTNPLVQLKIGGEGGGSLDTAEAQEGLETALLVRTVLNIGQLLRTGFGDAGAAIATSCVNTDGELDMAAPGAEVRAVFVHARVDALAAPLGRLLLSPQSAAEGVTPLTYGHGLSGKGSEAAAGSAVATMRKASTLFVNRVASIMHAVVVEHGGAILRNGDDGFVFVWKLSGEGVPPSKLVTPLQPGTAGGGANLPTGTRPNTSVEAALGSVPSTVTYVSDSDSSSGSDSEDDTGSDSGEEEGGGSAAGTPARGGKVDAIKARQRTMRKAQRLLRRCHERHLLQASPALFDPYAGAPAKRRGMQLPVTSLDPVPSAASAGTINLVLPIMQSGGMYGGGASPARGGGASPPPRRAVVATPNIVSSERAAADLALLACLRALAEVQLHVQMEAEALQGALWAAAAVPRCIPWRCDSNSFMAPLLLPKGAVGAGGELLSTGVSTHPRHSHSVSSAVSAGSHTALPGAPPPAGNTARSRISFSTSERIAGGGSAGGGTPGSSTFAGLVLSRLPGGGVSPLVGQPPEVLRRLGYKTDVPLSRPSALAWQSTSDEVLRMGTAGSVGGVGGAASSAASTDSSAPPDSAAGGAASDEELQAAATRGGARRSPNRRKRRQGGRHARRSARARSANPSVSGGEDSAADGMQSEGASGVHSASPSSDDEGGSSSEDDTPPSSAPASPLPTGGTPPDETGAPPPAVFVPRLSFGLHLGSALEGVLGSPRKVDSVFLGEGPDLAAALPQAGDAFGSAVTMSGEFVSRLTPVARALVRRLDRLVVVPSATAGAASKLRSAPAYSALVAKAAARQSMFGGAAAAGLADLSAGHAGGSSGTRHASAATPEAAAARGGRAVDVYTYDTAPSGMAAWLASLSGVSTASGSAGRRTVCLSDTVLAYGVRPRRGTGHSDASSSASASGSHAPPSPGLHSLPDDSSSGQLDELAGIDHSIVADSDVDSSSDEGVVEGVSPPSTPPTQSPAAQFGSFVRTLGRRVSSAFMSSHELNPEHEIPPAAAGGAAAGEPASSTATVASGLTVDTAAAPRTPLTSRQRKGSLGRELSVAALTRLPMRGQLLELARGGQAGSRGASRQRSEPSGLITARLLQATYGKGGYTPSVWLHDPLLVYLREGITRANVGVHCAYVHPQLGGVGPSRSVHNTASMSRAGPGYIFRLLYALGLALMHGDTKSAAAARHKLIQVVAVWNTVWGEMENSGTGGLPPGVQALQELVRHLNRLLTTWSVQDKAAAAAAAAGQAAATRPGVLGPVDWDRARLCLQFALKISKGLVAQSRSVQAPHDWAFSPWRPPPSAERTQGIAGDAACRSLLAYMARYNNKPPPREAQRLRTIEIEI